eukprot:5152612-Pyramimonas_sp.AAC.1
MAKGVVPRPPNRLRRPGTFSRRDDRETGARRGSIVVCPTPLDTIESNAVPSRRALLPPVRS